MWGMLMFCKCADDEWMMRALEPNKTEFLTVFVFYFLMCNFFI